MPLGGHLNDVAPDHICFVQDNVSDAYYASASFLGSRTASGCWTLGELPLHCKELSSPYVSHFYLLFQTVYYNIQISDE